MSSFCLTGACLPQRGGVGRSLPPTVAVPAARSAGEEAPQWGGIGTLLQPGERLTLRNSVDSTERLLAAPLQHPEREDIL